MKFKSAQRQHKICHTWRTPKRSFFTGTMKQKEQKHAWFSIFVGRTTMKLRYVTIRGMEMKWEIKLLQSIFLQIIFINLMLC